MNESVPAAEYFAAVAAPLLTALVTAFGVRLKQRLSSRDERHRVRRRVDEATVEVAFIRAWCEAVQHAGAGGPAADLTRAREDLQEIYDEVFTDGTAALRTPAHPQGWSLTRAWNAVVALRPPAGPGNGGYRRPLGKARLLRPAYWFALAWTVLLATSLAATSFGQETGLTAIGGLGTTLALSLLLGVLPAVGIRTLVLFLDEQAEARQAEARHTEAPPVAPPRQNAPPTSGPAAAPSPPLATR